MTSLILHAAHMAGFFIRQELPQHVYVMGEASISGQSCVRGAIQPEPHSRNIVGRTREHVLSAEQNVYVYGSDHPCV
jgi:hypothetical protein